MAAADDATYSTSPLSPHCTNVHCDQCGWVGYGLVQLVFIVAHQAFWIRDVSAVDK